MEFPVVSSLLPTDDLRLRLETKHLLAQENVAIFSWEFHMELPFKSLLETEDFSVVKFSKLAMQPMVS